MSLHTDLQWFSWCFRSILYTPWWQGYIEFIPHLPNFKELHPAIIRTHNNSIFTDPCQAEIVGGFCFHEGKLFEISFTIAEEFEELISHYTYLCIILRIEGNLRNNLRIVYHIIIDMISLHSWGVFLSPLSTFLYRFPFQILHQVNNILVKILKPHNY